MIARSPYRVPSMAEIDRVPDNGLRVVSTFSGCGGSCAQQWERLGRAVPPVMSFHIAKTIRDEILNV